MALSKTTPKIYVAFVSQNEMSIPIVTELQNSTGAVSIERIIPGFYRFWGTFPLAKTHCSGFGGSLNNPTPVIPIFNGASTVIGYYQLIFETDSNFALLFRDVNFTLIDLSQLLGNDVKFHLPEISIYG